MRSKSDEDQLAQTQIGQTTGESQKKSKITYSRELLLTFCELDVCKKLPSGFDSSLLSEFEDASSSVLERSRITGSLSSQNFKRGEYGMSPPTRGDSGNSSRGTQGRWDTRSSGSNDRDSDSQLDSESDFGWRIVQNSRRSRQNQEHDGLLGSGSFPKSSGLTSAPVTKVRGSSQFPLSRSNEPYQPPRPYKAATHSRRDDVINEETFGSSELSNEDRVEEERKRRASFELFRKEQKELQEKQKQFADKRKENVDPDIAALLANSEDDKKHWDKNIGLVDNAPNTSQGDSVQCSSAAQTSAPRPLVPPGFKGVTLERNLGTKSLISHSILEVGSSGLDENIVQVESDVVLNGAFDSILHGKSVSHADTSEKQYETKAVPTCFTDVNGKFGSLSSDRALNESSVGVVGPPYIQSTLPEVYEGPRNDEGIDFHPEKVLGHGDRGTTRQEHSTSILTKLFGEASMLDSGDSGFSEPADIKTEDVGNSIPFQSSKFTHWFLEEEKRPHNVHSSGKPEDLLSLIVNSEKDGPQVSRVSDKKQSIFDSGSNNLANKSVITTFSTVATIEPPYQSTNTVGSQGVLTCEDLEQSILSEFRDNRSNLDHSFQGWSALDSKAEKRPEVDNQASQHLLNLLQKGTGAKDHLPHPNHESSEYFLFHEASSANSVQNASAGDVKKVAKSENSLTLETLFGTAFMQELQSVKAPVSAQRGLVGGVTQTDALNSQGFPVPVSIDAFSPCISSNSTLDSDTRLPSHIQQSKHNMNEEAWLGSDTSQNRVGSNFRTVNAIDKPDESFEIQLPDEESLISLCDPVISQHSMAMPVGNTSKSDLPSSSSVPVDIIDQLAALTAVLKKGRSTMPDFNDPLFLEGPLTSVEPDPYQNQLEQPNSQFSHLQMNHGRSLFQPLDSHPTHMNSPLQIIGSENNVVPPEFSHRHFPSDINHHSSFEHVPNGPTRYSPAHHPMLQQMHMQGNLLPPHLLRGLPRGAPMSPYTINHMSGYAPEPTPRQNLPFHHHQPNYGGLEMPMQAHAVGNSRNNHPTFEELIQMERRANLKQMHPVAGTAHNLGNIGHGIDMGFRYM